MLRPAALAAEATSLESLIHQREAVDASVPLELAYAKFRESKVDYMAVVRDGRAIGLCFRGQIGFVMGSRFGFALYSHSPVETVMVPTPLIIRHDAAVRSVLDRALARHGEGFHEDVVLVDRSGHFLGLIQAETLAQLQSRLVAEQLEELRRQHAALRDRNLELFRATHAVRQSQGLYLGLFEGHALGVALLDEQGAIYEHNHRLLELFGFGESLTSIISLTAWLNESERRAFLRVLQSHARGEAAPATQEFTLHLPGRGPRTFRCSLGWIKETGQICACLDDITDQRVLERNLVRQEKQKLLDTLVGGIAHELNNKLTPVMGFAELLKSELSGNPLSFANYISQSVAEAAHIIAQLLQLSKPSSTVTELVDLRTVIEESLTMLRFQFRQSGCQVRTVLPSAPVFIMADLAQLKQVAINLLLNALHATEDRPNGSISLEAAQADGEATLAIADNGCGISPEHLNQIYDPFFTTKGPKRGSGLGLSICFSIVRQHAGEIAVDTRVGEGTRFTLTFASKEAWQPAAVSDLPRAELVRLPAVGAGGRVLVVDDEEVVRRLLQEILRSHFDCQVDLARNGAEGLEMLRRQDFAAVISDVQMPGMNGSDFFEAVRAEFPDLASRFAFITGYAGAPDTEMRLSRWQVPVIAKPFTVARLVDVVGALLRQTRTAGPERKPPRTAEHLDDTAL